MDDYQRYAAIDLATQSLAAAWGLLEILTAELTVEDVRALYADHHDHLATVVDPDTRSRGGGRSRAETGALGRWGPLFALISPGVPPKGESTSHTQRLFQDR